LHQECSSLADEIAQQTGQPPAALRGASIDSFADSEMPSLQRRLQQELSETGEAAA
jgi:hypothetical protein